jgi:septal ring factor EnvC (AmiA/AmiB activator)
VKRARAELQEHKLKLGDAIRDRQEEGSKMQAAMKQMATQIVELEEDLRYSEEHCEEYEALVQTLRDELEARPPK